jgi:hypothetical protein
MRHRVRAQYTFEEALHRSLVTPLPQQAVELNAVLVEQARPHLRNSKPGNNSVSQDITA